MEWKTEKLGDVCEIIKRGVGPKYLEEGGICVINQKCIRDHIINYTLARRHNLEIKKVNEERYVQIGDVLVNSTGTGTLGRVAQVRDIPIEPTTVDTHVTIVRPKKGLFHNDFFGYMLIKIEEEITSAGEGASGQTELARTKLENEFFVSYPASIPEQKRIVALLDTVFADLEQTRAKTEQNLKNARELFDSYLQQVFSQKAEGWVEASLKSITTKIGSGATPRGGKAAYKTEGMSLIRSMNVHDRRFKDKDLALIDDEQADKLSNVELQENDVLLNITGASVARCCVVPKEYLPARVNQHVSIIRVSDNTIKPELLCYLLTSKYYKDILLGIGEAGSTRQAITKVQIENFEVSYPESFENQDDFIKQLTVLETDILKLHDIYTKKLEALDELKKSILQKAFSGELTTSVK
tara:strand:+ start:15548 stop:16780 length:1233 start_codon:yes stop_codon:yes gene_type:complete